MTIWGDLKEFSMNFVKYFYVIIHNLYKIYTPCYLFIHYFIHNYTQISGSESFMRWLTPRTSLQLAPACSQGLKPPKASRGSSSLQLTPKAQGLPRPPEAPVRSSSLPRPEASQGLPRLQFTPAHSQGPRPPKAQGLLRLQFAPAHSQGLRPPKASRGSSSLQLALKARGLPRPQEAPSSLPLLPACSPHSQLAPLAPRASLGPWSIRGQGAMGKMGAS